MTEVEAPTSVTERDQRGPGGGELPGGFLSVAPRTSCAHSAGWWDTYTLDSKERQRAATAGLSARPASPAGRLRGASMRRAALGPQCGGFTAPRPRCCCCCCMKSCSSAEGPGRVMELDQMDFRLSMRTAEESSTEGPWPAQEPAGVLA